MFTYCTNVGAVGGSTPCIPKEPVHGSLDAATKPLSDPVSASESAITLITLLSPSIHTLNCHQSLPQHFLHLHTAAVWACCMLPNSNSHHQWWITYSISLIAPADARAAAAAAAPHCLACSSDFNKGSEECGDGMCDDLRLKAEGCVNHSTD
jgi:hypothetical protein